MAMEIIVQTANLLKVRQCSHTTNPEPLLTTSNTSFGIITGLACHQSCKAQSDSQMTCSWILLGLRRTVGQSLHSVVFWSQTYTQLLHICQMSEYWTVDDHLMSHSSDQKSSCSGWAGITTASPIEHLQHRETFCSTAHQVLSAQVQLGLHR